MKFSYYLPNFLYCKSNVTHEINNFWHANETLTYFSSTNIPSEFYYILHNLFELLQMWKGTHHPTDSSTMIAKRQWHIFLVQFGAPKLWHFLPNFLSLPIWKRSPKSINTSWMNSRTLIKHKQIGPHRIVLVGSWYIS